MGVIDRLLAGACLAAVLLQGVAALEQSLTMDEPYHLVAGYQALRFGANTINLEHPPLVKVVAALPLLFEDEPMVEEPVPPDRGLEVSHRLFDDPALAERARWRSRLLLLVAFALPFLGACYLLGAAVVDTRTGLLLAAAVGLSPAALPYLSLAQTDAAVALGFALCLLGGILLIRQHALGWALLAGAGLGIALAAKLSAVLLAPALPAAVLLARGHPPPRRRVALLLAATAVALAIPYGVYALANRDLDPAVGRATIVANVESRGTLVVEDRLERWREPLLALEDLSPELAQYSLGLLGVAAQDALGIYPSYAFGTIDSRGRWWYFPAAFLVRTPLVLLVALLLASVAGLRRLKREGAAVTDARGPSRESWLLAFVSALYLAFALGSSYNIGVRHLLPILPLLYLPAAAWAARTRLRTTLVAGVLLVEAVALTPVWMSATNTWWLGSANPTRLALAGSDGDYEQGLRTLAREARERGIRELRVINPTLTAGEIRAGVPMGVKVRPGDAVEPGWYAVSILVEQLVPAVLEAEPEALYGHAPLRGTARDWLPVWREIRRRGEDHGYAAGTFHLYRVPAESP